MTNIPQWKVGDVISASKLNDMVNAINDLLADQTENSDAYITLDELYDILKQYSDVGHTHSVNEIADLVLLTKLSQLQNDTSYVTEDYVTNAIANAQLGSDGEVDLTAYATRKYVDTEIEKIELTPGPQGEKGDDGYTPMKGVDYFTIADKEEMLSGYATESFVTESIANAQLGGDYDINSRMTSLENELNEVIEEVHNVVSTVDEKIATAEANMTTQVNTVKADMEATVAEVEADLEELSTQLTGSTKVVYVIDLNKFGITEGLIDHLPPYSLSEWNIAYNNKKGLQEALNFASKNDVSEVILPKGNYNVLYTNETGAGYDKWDEGIHIPSNLILNLNNSTLKVMYDSNNKNPYDANTGKLPHLLNGVIFNFSKSYNSGVINGELIGDLFDRSFSNTDERLMENSYGIYIDKGSKNCSIKNISFQGFMGDGITSMTSHDPDLGKSVMDKLYDYYPGYVDTSNGNIIQRDGCYVTDFIDITPIKTNKMIFRTNLGYARMLPFFSQQFRVSFYNADFEYISSEYARYLKLIKKPTNAIYIKISIFEEESGLDKLTFNSFQLTPPSPDTIIVENCTFKNNHRGGISNMPNNTIIDNCYFIDVAQGAKINVPIFPSSTRYCINCEDSVTSRIIIKNSRFKDSFHGLLLASVDVTVIDNVFENIESSAIGIYTNENSIISRNIFNSCGRTLSCGTSYPNKSMPRKIILSDNVVDGLCDASYNLVSGNWGNSILDVHDNTITGVKPSINFQSDKRSSVHNNIFYFKPNALGKHMTATLNASYMLNNSIYMASNSHISGDIQFGSGISSKGNEIVNLSNSKITLKPLDNIEGVKANDIVFSKNLKADTEENINVKNCEFNNVTFSTTEYGSFNNSTINYNFNKCDFSMQMANRLFERLAYSNSTDSKTLNLTFRDCIFTVYEDYSYDHLINLGSNPGENVVIKITFINCTFISNKNTTVSLTNGNITTGNHELELINTTLPSNIINTI